MLIYIFSKFLTFLKKIGNKIVFQLDLSFYTAIINATQTAVIDQFIALKNRKNEFYLRQTKLKLCSVVGYYRFLFDLSRILIEC